MVGMGGETRSKICIRRAAPRGVPRGAAEQIRRPFNLVRDDIKRSFVGISPRKERYHAVPDDMKRSPRSRFS